MSDLFGSMDKGETFNESSSPLADRLRPASFEEVFGQDHLTSSDSPLRIMCQNKFPKGPQEFNSPQFLTASF